MQTICLSASLRFEALIEETIARCQALGFEALFPNLNFGIDKEDLDAATLLRLCQDEFEAIERAEALYVLNPGGYIGTLVKIEIGYALGKDKPVFYTEPTDSLELDTLCSDVIPIDDIARFLEL